MTVVHEHSLEASLTSVIQDIADYLREIGLTPDAINRVTNCLAITTNGGNKLRGRSALDAGRILQGQDLSPSQIDDLLVLGCLIEIFNAAYLIWDDIMDKSETRRGQPCWYRHENVGLTAINDACLLKSVISAILKRRFRNHPAYIDFVELFSHASLRTELGQHCDLMASEKVLPLDQFTWDKYEFITANKTAYYTFYVPVVMPLLYFGLASPNTLSSLYDVSMMFGLLFQARDDFLDVYGDPSITGKVGTDIQENKCTWLAVQALKHCRSSDQKRVLESCYGSCDAGDIQRVRDVFEQLDLPGLFKVWDKETLDRVNDDIVAASVQGGFPKELLTGFLSKYFADPRRSLPWSDALPS